ncbi:hypothetical protein HK405_012045, partial [Cladochytrium tenue]
TVATRSSRSGVVDTCVDAASDAHRPLVGYAAHAAAVVVAVRDMALAQRTDLLFALDLYDIP